MKKYVFRLEPVLKIRKLKEENIRMELGQLLIHLNRIDDQINHDRNEINNYYTIQEKSLTKGILGNQLQAFSMLVIAKEKNIQHLEEAKKKQLELIDLKKNELAQARGDLKVIENLKEKDLNNYKTSYNKEVDQKVEEQTQIWLQFNGKKG
jgi:flagellar FliJ protein